MTALFPHQKEIVLAILKVKPDLKQIFLFGSRASGKARNSNADIDLGVVSDKRLTYLELAKIDENLEEIPTLYSIDVVDFSQRDDCFTREATKEARTIYEKR